MVVSIPPKTDIGIIVFFTGEFLPNFDLNNKVSTYAKDFSWKKRKTQIRQILKKKKFQIARFL
jgi:hypothetical protein